MWFTRVSIQNPVFATMVMVALCVLGIASYMRLGVEQMPDISPPVAFVDVAYPGAAPEAVEREVTKVIEEALNSIAGVKRITSRSFEGRSQTSVEFSLNADMDKAMRFRIYDAMNETLSQLHTTDYTAIGLADFGKPGNYFARQISRWTKQYQASETEKIEAMDNLIAWLPDAAVDGVIALAPLLML